MEVTSTTLYGWKNNYQIVEKRTTFDYPKGNDVTIVEKRSYEVTLYSSSGQLENHSSKGNNIDQMI